MLSNTLLTFVTHDGAYIAFQNVGNYIISRYFNVFVR